MHQCCLTGPVRLHLTVVMLRVWLPPSPAPLSVIVYCNLITFVTRSVSGYVFLNCQFFRSVCVRNDGLFAYVEWLGKPDYPFEGTPLIVRVRDNAPRCPASKIISIFDIDPTKIIYERSDVESCFYMLRLKCTDTILWFLSNSFFLFWFFIMYHNQKIFS